MTGITKVASATIEAPVREELDRKLVKRIEKFKSVKCFDKDKGYVFDVRVEFLGVVGYRAKLDVYFRFDTKEIENRHCTICRETHSLFYVNSQYNCSQCAYNSFAKRISDREKEMRSSGKEILAKFFKKK